MAIRIVRLGTPRAKNEGPRLGTVRRPPRGVPKSEFAARDFYDVWLPELSPSAPVVAWALQAPWTDHRWRQYTRKVRAEMSKPPASHVIEALAALSHHSDFSVGCYCADPARCHRNVLRELFVEAGASMADQARPPD